MGLFRTDSVALSYSNVEAAKQWFTDSSLYNLRLY
jgi:hypothetical protein